MPIALSVERLTHNAEGRTLEAALQVYSDPERLRQLEPYAPARMSVPFVIGAEPSYYDLQHEAYWQIRSPLEASLIERLRAGELIAMGLEIPISPSSTREMINPDLWRLLKPNFEESSAEGAGLTVQDILIFEPRELSMVRENQGGANVNDNDAETLTSNSVRVAASSDYTLLSVDGVEFHFGFLQAAVIRKLHEASLTGQAWCVGKALLADINSNTRSIGDLFRRQPIWRTLIEESRGRYRLRVAIGTMSATRG